MNNTPTPPTDAQTTIALSHAEKYLRMPSANIAEDREQLVAVILEAARAIAAAEKPETDNALAALGLPTDLPNANGSAYARIKWWKDNADKDAEEIHALRTELASLKSKPAPVLTGETPETDAKAYEALTPVEDEWVPSFGFVEADFARQLECQRDEARRELAAERAESDRLRKNIGCARNQGTTQFCHEAVDAKAEAERLAARQLAIYKWCERRITKECEDIEEMLEHIYERLTGANEEAERLRERVAELEHDMQAKGMEIAALAAELSETRDELNAVRAAGAGAPVEFVEVGLDGRKIPHTTDAKVWASEFVKTIAANPSIASDVDTMLGWFANAMCAQMDESERRHAAKSTPGVEPEHEPDFRCATFDQSSITPEIRAKMDRDRAKAEAAKQDSNGGAK